MYEFEGREVALLVRMPLTGDDRPKGKFGKFCKRCIKSGKLLKSSGDGTDADLNRDKFADNEMKREALDAAKKNIASLRDWDYFTTPNYIVLFSWLKGQRLKSYNLSKRLSSGLEKMRLLYQEYYPARQDMKMPYSVFRVCATMEQFAKYGDSPRGVIGWFSPASKELVVFQGGDKKFRVKGITETVAFHEGWHQYSNSYFGGTEMHRWFDEGHGDYFGSFVQRGKSWRYIGSRMRSKWVSLMVKKGDYVAFKEIVKWNKGKFYSGRASYYYAQAYSMIDFLRRGEKLGKRWNPRWGEILPIYRRVALKEKSADEAVKAAFDNVDFKALEAAWKHWVKSKHFKKIK